MPEILIDANVLVSLWDNKDKWRDKSLEILGILENNNFQIIITDVVLNESLNVICKRYENKGLSSEFPKFIKNIEEEYIPENIMWISENIKNYYSSCLKLMNFSKGLLNFNDCLLISCMKEKNIKYIFSFDEDFDCIDFIERIYSINKSF